MRQTKVGKRYAKALLGLAIEQNELEKVREDMQLVLQACTDSKELDSLLSSPIIKSDKKLSILTQIFDAKVSKLTSSFIKIIATREREAKLKDISFTFGELYLEYKNIIRAEIKSVNGVSAEVKEKIAQMIKDSYQKEVIFDEINDAKLIGGFVLTINDKQIDASISNKLNNFKKGFDYNPFQAEF